MSTHAEMLGMYERAMADCGKFVAQSAETDLRSGTPCAEWDLGALLAHMIGQNEGFAEAVRSGDAELSAYDARPVTPQSLPEDWSGSAQRVLDAFRGAPVDREVHIAGFGRFGVEIALTMQLADTIVHAWDVGMALGRWYQPSADLVQFIAALAARIAKNTPDGQPGVFAPPLDITGTDAWVDALRLLGRDTTSIVD